MRNRIVGGGVSDKCVATYQLQILNEGFNHLKLGLHIDQNLKGTRQSFSYLTFHESQKLRASFLLRDIVGTTTMLAANFHITWYYYLFLINRKNNIKMD